MSHVKRTDGFTLVELMLAMTFISILLLAIAMTTIQISNIYNKGITLREVNQVGRSVSEDIQRSIGASTPFDVTPKEDDSPDTASSKYVVRPGGGRLCLGSYTYAWNYGKALAGGQGVSLYNEYTDEKPVNFVKVADPQGALCDNPALNIKKSDATELVSAGDRDLVVHNFTIQKTADDADAEQAMYAISMLIGTNDREQLTANDASCKPPASGVGNEDYCSVNQFDIIARAGNNAGEE